jgi:ubiquinone biosynthesis protein UbiJ
MSLLFTGIAATLQTAVNRFLELDQTAKTRLQQLAGKVLAVELSDLPVILYFMPTEDVLQIFSHYDGAVDTRLRGTSFQLLSMSVSARPGENVFKGEVQIQGDVELGQEFQDILRAMDIDWEERLSFVVGDVAAHKMGNAVRSMLGWGAQTVASLQDNLAEYLKFETGTVPARFEIDAFEQDVDTLRNDVERLEARVQRLASASPAAAKAGKR